MITNWIFWFVIYLIGFLIIEKAQRHFSLDKELTRKTVHVIGGILCIYLSTFLSKIDLILICTGVCIAFAISKKYKIFESIHNIERLSFGEFFYTLGIISCALVALPDKAGAFRFGIAVLAFADTGAFFVGRTKNANHTKTKRGFLAFSLITFIIGLIFAPSINILYLVKLFLISLCLAGTELIFYWGSDNLVIAPLAALLFMFLSV